MSILKYATCLVISVLLVSCTNIGGNSRSSSQYETPDELMQAYILALGEEDERKILRLIVSDHHAESEVQNKIHRYGGVQLENVQIRYEPTENTFFIGANLQAETVTQDSEVKKVTDELFLRRDGDYWFIVLGTPNDGIKPASNPVTADQTRPHNK